MSSILFNNTFPHSHSSILLLSWSFHPSLTLTVHRVATIHRARPPRWKLDMFYSSLTLLVVPPPSRHRRRPSQDDTSHPRPHSSHDERRGTRTGMSSIVDFFFSLALRFTAGHCGGLPS
ncbi:hypothetical protein B0H16DRAFT_1564873 [Mycena metata]|uniref:Uncharacterized protein n=1 Tax=Mycena metata TaxID=1033252 RepID=A0AAD7IF61_9AGAR|nr:hypothetical protein B0H16DRAFT_1574315 [Mycena metata]KAJ7741681.1 hypothetical protein B0H16DRAFT_1564873 [Mycena metata]